MQIPFAILIVLLGLTGAFFIPTEKRLAEAAERGVGRRALPGAGRAATRSSAPLSAGLVLVAVFFMVTKLGA